MIHKPLDRIEKVDIESLVINAVAEGRTIEYKLALPSGKDADKKEFLADISSFANAAGGDILYGVEEQRDANGNPTGFPSNIPGLAGFNADQEILRLETIIRTGIGPRIAGLHPRAIDGFADGPVLLIRIQKSYAAPHMVTFQEHSRFYSRNSRGKYPLDVGEIRAAFALSDSLPEKIRRFRDERLVRIVADETPVPLPARYVRFVLHVLPIASLDPIAVVDIVRVAQNPQKMRPLCAPGADFRYNFDGFITFHAQAQSSHATSYVQMFRNGAIEAVDGGTLEMPKKAHTPMRFAYYEGELIRQLPKYLMTQRDLGLEPPAAVMLSIIGAKGYRIITERDDWRAPHEIDRDALLVSDLLVEDYSTPAEVILRPAFDTVWQAAGWSGSQSYDKNGRWVAR